MATANAERLNALAAIGSAASYLEIGVQEGKTFLEVDVPKKVGVDPRFEFDVNAYASSDSVFHEATSDHYFSALASVDTRFDLIFLDGLHTFDQTFRDFCASMAHSHTQTIWLIDDTCPSSRLAAHPNLRVTNFIRRRLRIRDGRWMGDVFKVVFAIHDFYPQFSYATFPGHGATVVWRATRRDFAPTWNSLKTISSFGYRDYLRFTNSHLHIDSVPRILEAVRLSRIPGVP